MENKLVGSLLSDGDRGSNQHCQTRVAFHFALLVAVCSIQGNVHDYFIYNMNHTGNAHTSKSMIMIDYVPF